MLTQYLAERIVDDVCSRVVASDGLTTLYIHSSQQCALDALWQLSTKVYREVVLLLGVDDADVTQCTCITNLTTHLCIERCLAEYYLIEVFALLIHFAVAEHLGLAAENVVSYKLCIAFAEFYPITQLLFIGLTTHFLLMLKRLVVFLLVGGETVLAKDKLCQVKWETVCIFECEHVYTRYLFTISLLHEFVEQADTFIQGAEERVLFALDDRSDLTLLFY